MRPGDGWGLYQEANIQNVQRADGHTNPTQALGEANKRMRSNPVFCGKANEILSTVLYRQQFLVVPNPLLYLHEKKQSRG